jgi:hypothetical protein
MRLEESWRRRRGLSPTVPMSEAARIAVEKMKAVKA